MKDILMNEKDIKKLMEELNQDKVRGYIITRPLTDTVDFAKVWHKRYAISEPVNSGGISPHTFYFIRDKTKKCIAAVMDMDNNLKWHVLPEYRKCSQFSTSLKETILPHLLQSKPIQLVSFNKAEVGEKTFIQYKKMALSSGLVLKKEDNGIAVFVLAASSLGKREYIAGKNTHISTERLEQMKRETSFMINLLEAMKAEYEFKLGELLLAEGLNALIEGLKAQAQVLNGL